ncbi:hypothetical protein ABZ816_20150 [Actinosynnema sp. NPDC047251]|uniref:Putative secreted protein n=1 Tax=Saccharothrix espanaensis (strain ATCC 51144 / DSM 44229 / JCM 9112 / NBRC 15066 / NRRL 15764) TaxID=1179773 RepID=K0KBE7_SACES|nr:hypothetical protein [Saccharothrix espanaensis]CCH34877.1 putative secreted protein [Saccharothrix espanaensis DSM 44229]
MRELPLVALLLVTACAEPPPAGYPPETGSPAQVRETEVESYDPWGDGLVKIVVERRAVCAEPSKVALRPDAWECRVSGDDPSTDGGVHDPCLAHPTEPKAACPEGAEGRSAYYVMTLDAPLPPRSPPIAETAPWMVELWSGDRCIRRRDLPAGLPTRDGLAITMTCAPADPRRSSRTGAHGWGEIDTTSRPWTLRVSAKTSETPVPAAIKVAYR